MRIAVERVDAGQQVGFRQRGRVTVIRRVQTVVLARLHFIAHIHFAGGVITDEHHGKPGLVAARGERRGARGDVGAKFLGKGEAVDQLGCHGGRSRMKR